MQLPLVAVEWFMCLFVNTLRPEVAFRVWDIFLNEGAKTLFRIALALLKRHEPELLVATDAAQLFMTIKEIGIDIVDADDLIQLAYKTFRCPTKTNYSSTKISNILSPNGVGSASSLVALKRNPTNTFKSVPRDLVGIGLAHLGPKALYNKFSAAAVDNGMTTYVMNVISGHRRPSFDVSESNSSDGKTSDSSAVLANLISPLTSAQKTDNIVHTETMAATAIASTTTDLGEDELSESQHALHAEVTLKDVAPGSVRPRKKRDAYRNFGTNEIATWRNQFRPEVEMRILSMENARNAYRRRRESMDRAEAILQQAEQEVEAVGGKIVMTEVTESLADVAHVDRPPAPQFRPKPAATDSARVHPIVSNAVNIPSANVVVIPDAEGEEEDDGDEYEEQIRRDSMSLSPDEKMHNAAPKLWDMLFEENQKHVKSNIS